MFVHSAPKASIHKNAFHHLALHCIHTTYGVAQYERSNRLYLKKLTRNLFTVSSPYFGTFEFNASCDWITSRTKGTSNIN